jgi:hypothetical protein
MQADAVARNRGFHFTYLVLAANLSLLQGDVEAVSKI